MYPVMLSLEGKPCLVVGGGKVALRKVEGLVDDGAQVTVIAKVPVAELEQLAKAKAIQLESRPYKAGEVTTYALVFAATDDRRVNQQVFEDATARGIWVNVADDPEFCTFHLPARVKRGALQLALASEGGAPFLVRRLRQAFDKRMDPTWAEWIEAAAGFRKAVLKEGLSVEEQNRCFDAFFKGTFDAEKMSITIPTAAQLASWLK